MYKRLEGFQCMHDPTSQIPLHYSQVDDEIRACLNNIERYEFVNINDKSLNLYILQAVNKSNIYIKDYFDNFFNISFAIKLNVVKPNKTILQTNFIHIRTNSSSNLEVNFSRGSTNKVFSTTLVKDKIYILKLNNLKTIKKSEVLFGAIENEDDESRLEKIIHDIGPDVCDYSSGNFIYIGSDKDRTESSFINASIGNINLDVDPTKYDEFEADFIDPEKTIPIPTYLVCDTSERVAEQSTEADETETAQQIPGSHLTPNFITLKCDLTLEDLQRNFKKNAQSDIFEGNIDVPIVKEYFDNLEEEKGYMTNFKEARLDKDTNNLIFENSYSNINNSMAQNTYFAFGIKNNTFNQDVVRTFNFLDKERIKYLEDYYDEVYIFIYGVRTQLKSIFKFLRIQKPIFIAVYKNMNDPIYYFEALEMNLDLFYDYSEEFTSSFTSYDNANLYKDFFRKKINNLSSDNSSNNIRYTKNFFRLYNDKIDVGNINVSIYENNTQKDTMLIQYKRDTVENECTFIPKGETIFDCFQNCTNFSQACNETDCRNICKSCTTKLCKWNLLDINLQNRLVPSEIKLKGFAGDKQIKLTWIQPLSTFPIEIYYIMVSSSVDDTQFDLYSYEGQEEMVEYFITDLKNEVPYSFYVFSKNKSGISAASNRVTLIPKKNKLLNRENLSKNTFSDSIQNYYKNKANNMEDDIITNVNKNIQYMDMMEDLSTLKEVLVNKILENRVKQNTNINIF